MTPKEKSEELYTKYGDNLHVHILAKQCALIAVEEIIKYLTSSLDVQVSLDAVNFWQQVKQEIEKL